MRSAPRRSGGITPTPVPCGLESCSCSTSTSTTGSFPVSEAPAPDAKDKTILAQQALIDKQQNEYAAIQTQLKEQQDALNALTEKHQNLRDGILSLLRS